MAEFDPKGESVMFLNEFNNSLVRLTQELPSVRNKLVETLDTNCPLDKHIKCGQLMQEAQKNLKVRYTLDQVILSIILGSSLYFITHIIIP